MSRLPHRVEPRGPAFTFLRQLAIGLVVLLLAASSTAAQPPEQPAYELDVLDHRLPPALSLSERALVALTVRNGGTEPWTRAEPIGISYHWVDAQGAIAVFEGLRTRLPSGLAPGQTLSICATVVAPDRPGRYELHWDAVYEERFWFSHRNGVVAAPATVEVGYRSAPKPTLGRSLVIAAFWVLTLTPILVAAAWLLRRTGTRMPSWDDDAFDVTLFGLGHLFVVLHVLVFSVGLSLGGVAAGLIATYVAAVAWVRLTGRAGNSPEEPMPAPSPERRISLADVVGASLALALLLQWIWQASATADVAGTDAAHYHLPHAVNFLRGIRPTAALATPHLYPMSTSVWAAWFMLPFSGPLLVDLATLPALVLLVTSSGLIFRIICGRSGLSWVPWLMLVAFSGFLPRLSLLMSADLSYAAATLAVTAAALRLWRDGSFTPRTVVAMGLAAGWLLGTKSTGGLSLAAIGLPALIAAASIARMQGRSMGLRLAPVLLACGAAVAAGGVWLLRNWWAFGSPLAPFGFSVLGLQIFAGPAASSVREYLSVVGDLKGHADYPLIARAQEAIVQMFGAWIVWLPTALLVVGADAAAQLARTGTLSSTARRKLLFIVGVVLAFLLHAYVVAGLPWTSLDWTRNLSVRYLLPFYFLFLLAAFSCLFMDGLPWDRSRIGLPVGWAVIVGGAVWHAAGHSSTLNLPSTAWLLVVDPTLLFWVAAAALVLVAYRQAARLAAFPHWPAVAFGALAFVAAVAWHEGKDSANAEAAALRLTTAESSCLALGMPAAWEHRGLYLATAAYQRAKQLQCDHTRFFLASRFDRPLDLQDVAFRNTVVDLSVAPRGGINRVPQPGGCDVVIVRTDALAGGSRNVFDRLFGPAFALEPVATYGRYQAYVRP